MQFNWMRKIPIVTGIFFLATWFFTAYWYGEVLVMAREYSYFSFTSFPLQNEPTYNGWGWMWMTGRGLLNLYAFPWLGGAVTALILTAGCRAFGYIIGIRRRWQFVQFLPGLGYVLYIVQQGFNAFIYSEPGKILGIPFLVLCILALCTLPRYILRDKRKQQTTTAPERTEYIFTTISGFTIAMILLGIGIYGELKYPYIRTTARLQQLLQEQQWEKMIETARAYPGSNRQVAAYHAIALHHTGKLLDGLFHLRYDFEPIQMTGLNGKPSEGREIYEAECNFHAGLWQTAYRKDMELTVLNGICTSRLKRMIRCAVMGGETNLALRYLHILSQQPFEQDFVERYRRYAHSSEALLKDAELAFVQCCAPKADIFEGYLTSPTFLGYYHALQKPGNKIQRDAAIAASLYTKNIPVFMHHVSQYSSNEPLPSVMGDALTLVLANQSLPDTQARELAIHKGKLNAFTRSLNGADPRTAKDEDLSLFEKYKGYYLYYYFFGNRNKEKPAKTSEPMNNTVN